MATIKHIAGKGAASSTGTTESTTANSFGSTTTIYVTGQKQTATWPKARGVYILESAGVYRWVKDEPLGASATEPTTYTHGD